MAQSLSKSKLELLTPGPLVAGRAGRFHFKITLGAPVAAGGGFLLFPPITEMPWIWSMVRWNIGGVIAHGPSDARVEAWVVRADRLDHAESCAELVRIVNQGRALREGEAIEIIMADTRVQTFAMRRAWFTLEEDRSGRGSMAFSAPVDLPAVVNDWPLYHKIADVKQHKALEVDVEPGPPARLVAVLSSRPEPDGRVMLRIRAEDAFGNATRLPDACLKVESQHANLAFPPCAERQAGTLSWAAQGRFDGAGTAYVRVTAPESGLQVESSCVSTELDDAIYFGDLHGHTSLSDGLGTGEAFFEYARDVAFCDFVSLTDHNRFDSVIIELTETYNAPGRFVTIFGRERGLGDMGHRNVFGLHARDVDVCAANDLFNITDGTPVLIVPHHTNAATLNHWKQASFSPTDPARERLIELLQIRGSFETEEVGGWVFDIGNGASIQSALALGRRYGFVGGSDTHRGTPGGTGHAAGPYFYTWRPVTGLTAVAASSLTRDSIWNGLWNRATYATTGAHILVKFAINGAPMGSELESCAVVRAEAFVAGTAPIEVIELLRDNQVCHTVPGNGSRVARLDFTDASPGRWYYLRVRQVDGQCAWASPVWIGAASLLA